MRVFSEAELSAADPSIALELISHSFIAIAINERHWNEDTFNQAFQLPGETKAAYPFHSDDGFTLGYKVEDSREFFETRLRSDGTIEPDMQVSGYAAMVARTMGQLAELGSKVLAALAIHFHIEPSTLLALVDSSYSTPFSSIYSSSVLRICSYKPCSSEQMSFGAHTDTSLLTIAPLARVEGLELFDNYTLQWQRPEQTQSLGELEGRVVILVGDVMQAIFKHSMRACVHRVRRPEHYTRFSCPLLIRGKKDAIIHLRKTTKNLDNSNDDEIMPLEGVSINDVHAILDLKRRRCAKQHSSDESEWVLAAFDVALEATL